MRPLRERRFRSLWIGQSISYLGDQFHLFALPWLVLAMTGDPAQLGLILATAGVPRAALMLVGGVWADRISPRTIMIIADLARAVIIGALAITVALGQAQLWMVYVLALSFGIVAGFFAPAAQTAVPRLVSDAELESGNGLMMGAQSVAGFAGPALAGSMLAMLGVMAPIPSAATWLGLGIAFGIDAVSFLASAFFLVFVGRLPGLAGTAASASRDLADGLRYVVRNPVIRTMVVLIGTANLLAIGPFAVGIPTLAATHFSPATVALAALTGAAAVGNVVGMVLGATLPRPNPRGLTVATGAVFALFAVSFTVLATTDSLPLAVGGLALAGVLNGYLALIVMTTLQRCTQKAYLGRVMSVVTLSMVGLGPISQVIAGPLAARSTSLLFGVAAAGLLALGVFALTRGEAFARVGQPEGLVEPAEDLVAS
jgi:MFS family permease